MIAFCYDGKLPLLTDSNELELLTCVTFVYVFILRNTFIDGAAALKYTR